MKNGGYHVSSRQAEYSRILGVESWPFACQIAVTRLAIRAYSGKFKHKWDDNSVSVSRAELNAMFKGNRKRIEYVQTKILMKPHDGYCMKSGITKAYQLEPLIHGAIERMDRKRIEQQLNDTADRSVIKDGDNKRVKRITATRKKETKAGSLHCVPAWCPVNITTLARTAEAVIKTIDFMDGRGSRPKALASELESIAEKIRHNNDKKQSQRTDNVIMRDYLSRVLNELTEIIELASSTENYGYMPVRYQQSQAGRWYGLGSPTLQNCTRLARTAALHGYYSFDIESCHHAIVLQIAQSMGIHCENLEYYVSNKENVRQKVAEQIKAPESSVKASLIAMIYGAGINPYGAIAKELTPKKLTLALTIPIFAGLHRELGEIFEAMLEHSGGAESGQVINVLGLAEPFSRRKDDQRRLAAHLLQGIESQALQAALSTHKNAIVPLHDGWVCTKPESHAEAEKAIKTATGFDLQVNAPDKLELSGI
jgi:hypothetical protein